MDEDAVNEQVPDWNADMDAEWERQMQNAMPEGPSAGAAVAVAEKDIGASLEQALGLPEEFKDLWPGHCYIPPKIKELKTILPIVQSMREEFLGGNIVESLDKAVTVVQMLARRMEGDTLVQLTSAEIESLFDEDEIAEIVNHMMYRQGLAIQDSRGNALSERSIGAKNFVRSVASTPDTDSNTAEN